MDAGLTQPAVVVPRFFVRQRITLDEATFDRMAGLREVGTGHWAAV
mgnify:CR=1 FL=1